MKLLKRLFFLLSVFVCCFALGLNSLTVSAESSSCLFSPTTFQLLEIYASDTDVPATPPASYSWTSNDKGYGILSLTTDASYLNTWSAKFKPLSKAGDLVVRDNYDLDAGFYYRVTNVGSSFMNQDITGAMYITAPDGTVYQFPIKDINPLPDSSQIYVHVAGAVSTKNSFHFSDCTVELRFSCLSSIRGVNLTFTTFNLTALEYITGNTAHIVESVEKGFADLQAQQNQNTQDIIDNQDQNTQDIIANDNENAGKTHGFLQNIKDGIGNLVNQIVALPGKIWEAIESGLKALFIPDEEYIASYKSKWDELLSSRFGAVYESSEILIELAQGITEADQTDTVSIPRVAIPMPDNNEFVFGPYDVKVVPDASALKFLVDACKMITSIVAVFLLINALRKRWEEVMNAD